MLCQISGKISIDVGGTYGTVKITCINTFKPRTLGFLRLILCESFVCMFVCVCVHPRLLITSGVMWHDMDHIQLVKQVSTAVTW